MNDKDTNRVLAIMDEINTVPRQSNHLEKIHPWIMDWGRRQGFDVKTDSAQNILITVPATPGYEKSPTIVLQGHMDMVCEKRSDVEHDFRKDPVISWRDGDWLRAKGTSLGADNAIALALFFDLATDPEAEHPKLEILVTADEETGLVGAQNMEAGFLTGTVLMNLDSEDEGVFTIGCAGGMDTNLNLPVVMEAVPPGYEIRRLEVGGLEGGHSGIEIHVGKANANVLMLRGLREIIDLVPEARVGELRGGTAHNAIPREASALLAVPFSRLEDVEALIGRLEATLKSEYAVIEPNLSLALTKSQSPEGGLFNMETSGRIVDALRLIPHGVKHMSAEIEGVVDTSMNFAVLSTKADMVSVLTNRRSAVMSRGADFSAMMFGLARLYGGSYETGNQYPPWEPRTESDVMERAKMIWTDLFGKEPEVEVTHAGLECGAIGATFSNLDMISFGPTIMQPHSPDERMLIPSVGRVRKFFRELLKSYR
ncbi:MAG: aminoacyl-histidine dipeptidase [Spirochaetaceae bacterium]|nr:aminoacyl-histidine dipeptidase [Spirochaetaceae bacterium]